MVKGRFLTRKDDLSLVFSIRKKVFCDELGMAEEIVFDNKDDLSMHAIVLDDNDNIVSIGRCDFNGVTSNISFVCTIKNRRRERYGDFAVRMMCDRAFMCGAQNIVAECPNELLYFLQDIGFKKEKELENSTVMVLTKTDFSSPCQHCGKKD